MKDDQSVTWLANLALGLLEQNGTHNNISFAPLTEAPGQTIYIVLLLLGYGILSLISFFGNSLVCYVILKNKRLHTATNIFIVNLAVSDLLLTCVNIPFNIARHLLEEWPFGDFLCHLVNMSLMVSVYVSTYTLTAIAIDRHRVVLTILTRKMSKWLASVLLVVIWVTAICLSLPYGLYSTVQEVSLWPRPVKRCRSDYPEPSDLFEKSLTVATFILQYCVPLTLIALAYGRIVRKLWVREHVGAVTKTQHRCQQRAKRRSIKLLIAVVVVFAICWLPLNLYHLLTDLHPNANVFRYNSRVFFTCHWIAISSTCYNPFVYCWLNEHFREEVKARFRWCGERTLKVHPGNCSYTEGSTRRTRGPWKRHRFLTRSSIFSSSSRSMNAKPETMVMQEEDIFYRRIGINGAHARHGNIDSCLEHTSEVLQRFDIATEIVQSHPSKRT